MVDWVTIITKFARPLQAKVKLELLMLSVLFQMYKPKHKVKVPETDVEPVQFHIVSYLLTLIN